VALLISTVPGPAQAMRAHAGVSLALVAYSTPQEAYAHIIPAFQKTAAGQGVQFTTSYGASGSQSRAVVAGLPADVVNFSLAPDMTRLVSAGLVAKNWDSGPTKGMVTDSVVVLAVRKGNPKHITGWNDLIKPGIDVITPNPFTSGGARWNIMAAYGAQLHQGKTQAQAVDYLTSLFAHVSVQNASSREELQTFLSGKGDVMIAYEDEAITAQHAGASIDYIVPAQTILIENPIAVTTSTHNPTQANAFVQYLLSPAGQRLWGENGYRPVLPAVAKTFKFPTPASLFTIDSLGGWTKVTKQFFDPNTGIVAQIERGRGVSTGA
jgi:sulfate transport system substrate-binding protein